MTKPSIIGKVTALPTPAAIAEPDREEPEGRQHAIGPHVGPSNIGLNQKPETRSKLTFKELNDPNRKITRIRFTRNAKNSQPPVQGAGGVKIARNDVDIPPEASASTTQVVSQKRDNPIPTKQADQSKPQTQGMTKDSPPVENIQPPIATVPTKDLSTPSMEVQPKLPATLKEKMTRVFKKDKTPEPVMPVIIGMSHHVTITADHDLGTTGLADCVAISVLTNKDPGSGKFKQRSVMHLLGGNLTSETIDPTEEITGLPVGLPEKKNVLYKDGTTGVIQIGKEKTAIERKNFSSPTELASSEVFAGWLKNLKGAETKVIFAFGTMYTIHRVYGLEIFFHQLTNDQLSALTACEVEIQAQLSDITIRPDGEIVSSEANSDFRISPSEAHKIIQRVLEEQIDD